MEQEELRAKIARYKRLARASDDETRERIDALVGELEEQLDARESSHPAHYLSGQT